MKSASAAFEEYKKNPESQELPLIYYDAISFEGAYVIDFDPDTYALRNFNYYSHDYFLTGYPEGNEDRNRLMAILSVLDKNTVMQKSRSRLS